MAESTKVTLTVENPKLNIRYYVVAQPVFNPPALPTYILGKSFLNDDETSSSNTDDTLTSSSSSESSFNIPMTVPAKQVRNTQPQCQIKSCSKFCKRGAKLCTKCEQTCSQELTRISLERASRNK